MLDSLKEYINDTIRSLLNQVIRVGMVTTTYPGEAKVRVKFPDADDLTTYKLSVLFAKTYADQVYHMPDTGDHVLCIFLPFGLEQGFVLGAVYSTVDPVPVADQDKHHTAYSDGTTIEYDRKLHKMDTRYMDGTTVIYDAAVHRLSVNCVGFVTVNSAVRVNITAPNVNIN